MKNNPLLLFPLSIIFCISLVLIIKFILTGTVMLSENSSQNFYYVCFIVIGFVVGVCGIGLILDENSRNKND